MKNIQLPILILFCLCLQSSLWGQASVTISGGFSENSSGSVEYALGQMDFNYTSSDQGSIAEGLLHSYEILTSNRVIRWMTNRLQVYPNPTSQLVQLSLTQYNGEGGDIIVTNPTGRVVQYHPDVDLVNHTLDVRDLPAGLYTIQVKQEQKYSKPYKLVKVD